MVNIKSYLNTAIFTARLSAASAAVFILSSCGGKYGNPSLELQDNPAGIYREYLSGIRMQDGLSTDSLTVLLRQWLTVRDSVFAHVRRDTTQQVHSGAREECLTLHDSIRAEFSRLAISMEKPCDFDPFGQTGLSPFGYNMIDPLKSWCWGSILFYPFKISRFS